MSTYKPESIKAQEVPRVAGAGMYLFMLCDPNFFCYDSKKILFIVEEGVISIGGGEEDEYV